MATTWLRRVGSLTNGVAYDERARPSRRRRSADSVAAPRGQLEPAVGEHPVDLLGEQEQRGQRGRVVASGRAGSVDGEPRSRVGGTHRSTPRAARCARSPRASTRPATARRRRRSTSAARSSRRRTGRGRRAGRRRPTWRRPARARRRRPAGAPAVITPVDVSLWVRAYTSTSGVAFGAMARARLGLDDLGARRGGARPRTAAANFDENSPNARCWLRRSMRQNVAASQNSVGAAVAEHDLVAVGQREQLAQAVRGPVRPPDLTVGWRWLVPRNDPPVAASAASASGRTFDGPDPKRPSAGQQVGGERRIFGGASARHVCQHGRRCRAYLRTHCAPSPSRPRWPSTPRPRRSRRRVDDVIGFGAGEPDFPTPAHIVEAAAAGVPRPRSTTATRPPPGCPSCARPSRPRRQRDSGYEVEPARCSSPTAASRPSTTRSPPCSTRATRCSCRRRTGSPTPRPSRSPAAYPVVLPTDESTGFRVTVEQLEAARTERTKVLLFVSPSNPTGAVYPPAEVEAIGRWAAEHGIWVITDEIYEHLVYGDAGARSMPVLVPELADRCVVVNGVAKTYAMTGWRVGWMVGPARRHRRRRPTCSRTPRRTSRTSPSAPRSPRCRATSTRSPRCGPRSTAGDAPCVQAAQRRSAASPASSPRARSTASRPSRACSAARSAAGRPAPTSSWPTSSSTKRVAIVPGEAFGAPGYARLSYALGDDDLVEGVTRIAEAPRRSGLARRALRSQAPRSRCHLAPMKPWRASSSRVAWRRSGLSRLPFGAFGGLDCPGPWSFGPLRHFRRGNGGSRTPNHDTAKWRRSHCDPGSVPGRRSCTWGRVWGPDADFSTASARSTAAERRNPRARAVKAAEGAEGKP